VIRSRIQSFHCLFGETADVDDQVDGLIDASSFILSRTKPPTTIRRISPPAARDVRIQANGMVITSVRRRKAADFEQLEPEGLDLGEHAVQRSLIAQCPVSTVSPPRA
jgi:hypothetical protein